jgi:SAM-dependent methyltransferase
MADQPIRFDDGATYERYMGKWSQLVGDTFLDWLAPKSGLRWLDVGCGNGAFTETLVDRRAPVSVQGIDPSEGQLAFARTRPASRVAQFRQGDAMAAKKTLAPLARSRGSRGGRYTGPGRRGFIVQVRLHHHDHAGLLYADLCVAEQHQEHGTFDGWKLQFVLLLRPERRPREGWCQRPVERDLLSCSQALVPGDDWGRARCSDRADRDRLGW